MKKRINVLITSCGRRVELVKQFVAAKILSGAEGVVVTSDMDNTAPALYFSDAFEIMPRLDSIGYIPKLLAVIKKYDINLVVPTIDTELILLAQNKEYLEKNSHAIILVSEVETVEICNDKILSARFFANNGFGCPRTLTPQDIIAKDYYFPLFIKPLNGSSSVNAFKVNSDKELEFFMDYVPNPIIQQCVSGTEYTVDVFLDFDGRIISCVPRRRLSTRGGEVLKGMIDLNKIVIKETQKLVSVLSFIGHVTVQGFLCDDGSFSFIEINPRFGGGAPMSIKAGANSCLWLFKLLMEEIIDVENIQIADKMILSRFDDCVIIENCHD